MSKIVELVKTRSERVKMNIKESVLETLKKDDRIWENEEINKTLLFDLIDSYDDKMLKNLLENEEVVNNFCINVNGKLVLKISDFKFFIEENKIYNSYTKYENRIGLTNRSKFLKDSSEVVLDFPFKDCILEGGQTTEDGNEKIYKKVNTEYEINTSKIKEVFFNKILAKNEIDRLLDQKAFCKWKRIDKDGEHEVQEIKRNEDGIISENLLIKGNNLIAMHSLKRQFAGRVRLIFIDPPYNTGSDTFAYNDNFNHSTWLTFMKNRLEIARELLTEDGSIYVSIDSNEVHYLKVLMDEIFGRECFKREIIWRIGWVSGFKSGENIKNYIRNHDTILYYTKNPNNFVFNKEYAYNKFEDYQETFNDDNKRSIKKKLKELNVSDKDSKEFVEYITKLGLPERYPLEDTWNCSVYDKLNSIAVVSYSGEKVSKMLGVDEIKGQKAEKLVQRIIEVSSNKGDIVMDFHVGTGTTCAVAHKMGVQYIGIEQMDYIEDTTKERLKKVISGKDNSGITREVNWKGGGDFIYCELAQFNQIAAQKIINAKSLNELMDLFENELCEKYFLDYNLNIREFKEKVIKEKEFIKLGLKKQKKMFLDMLDLNQMYVNYSEINDEKYDFSDYDKTVNRLFYL